MPSQTINLNNTTPAAPTGAINVEWQGDTPSLDPTVVRNASAYVPIMVGDSGSGGSLGLVPAPAAGDAAAGKVLKADGSWYVPLLPAGTANQVIATPNGFSGASELRALVAADLPLASNAAFGAVKGDGSSISISAGIASVVGGGGGGGMTNPMTDVGDLIIGGAAGAPARLAAGTAAYVLTSNGPGSAPSYQAASGGGGGLFSPDTPPSSPTAYDDEFDGSSLNTSLWTQVINGASNGISLAASSLVVTCAPHSGDNFTSISQPIPSPPYTFGAKASMQAYNSNYIYAGMIVSDSSGKSITLKLMLGGPQIGIGRWNANDSHESEQGSTGLYNLTAYLRIVDDGTNLMFLFSFEGSFFVTIYTVGRTAFLSAPAYVGLMAGVNSGSPLIANFDWFRRIA